MPHRYSHLSDTPDDPFLPPFNHSNTQRINQEPLDGFLSTVDQNPTFSPTELNRLDGFEYNLVESQFIGMNSTNAWADTPDFSGQFSHLDVESLSDYASNPAPGVSHPYPYQFQQSFPPAPSDQELVHCPLAVLPAANISQLHPFQHIAPGNQFLRRRLLNEGNEALAPTLCPLRKPIIAFNTADEDASLSRSGKKGEDHKKGKSDGNFDSNIQKGPQISGSVGLRIDSRPSRDPRWATKLPMMGQPSTVTPLFVQETPMGASATPGWVDVRFKHMFPEEKAKESTKIIEIGALAVINTSKDASSYSPSCSCSLPEPTSGLRDHRKTLLNMVDKMEHHLQQEFGFSAKGQAACEMMRETLNEVAKIYYEDSRIMSVVVAPEEIFKE
ncbi:hypothetical protein CC78DRAFT_243499 [Lojkania enalia]|uniref:Uncharacterized protein n=1 Tax=Lojkania enalia TaxID=147567 RepID=A0A9P4NB01_9PLEO|nr:hypothetical protein CC78DRAFT_243499 [Didymosphaeria enalia]